MNKIITSTALLSICLLSSCSTIKGFRNDPSTWGKKGKKEEIKKVSKKTNRPIKRTVPRLHSNETISSEASNRVNNVSNSSKNKGRTVKGMMEPNVTNLPDNKDLQESNTVAPVPAPLKPKLDLDAPVTPLLKVPADLTDPSAPLPSNP